MSFIKGLGLSRPNQLAGLTYAAFFSAALDPYAGALLDADYVNNKYRFNGAIYSTEAELNTAALGVKVGITRTFGPYVVGPELYTDGDFTSGVAGFASSPTYVANGDVSNISGTLRMAYTGASTLYRARRQTTVESNKGYVLSSTILSQVGIGLATLSGSTNADLGGAASGAITLGALPQAVSVGFAPPFTPAYFGYIMSGTALNTSRMDADNVSLKRADPLNGYNTDGWSFTLEFVTPATVPSAQALWTSGDDSERQRNRYELGTNFHLYLVITRNGTETDRLDIGTLTANTTYKLTGNFTNGRIYTKVGNNQTKLAVSTIVPGSTKIWLGRSFTGETFTGTFNRFSFFSYERAERDMLVLEGDSYAAGAGGVSLTNAAIADSHPAIYTAVGGTALVDQLTRMQAKPNLYKEGVFVHWDGSPAGNDMSTAMAYYRNMIAMLGHDRFVIVAPVRLATANGTINGLADSIKAALQAEWPGRIVDAQTILASHATAPGDNSNIAGNTVPISLLQGDATHLITAAMGYVWTEGVKPIITANGW